MNINTGGISEGYDLIYDVEVDYTEGGACEPDALTLVIGKPPAIRLTWDDPCGWLDDSFNDFQSTPYDYERTVTATSFHVLASAYTTVTEVTSSNNAEKARVHISASSGFQVTDSDYYGL